MENNSFFNSSIVIIALTPLMIAFCFWGADIQSRYQLTADGSVHYTEFTEFNINTRDSITLKAVTIPKQWLTQFDSTYSDQNYKLVARKFINKAYASYLLYKFTFYGNYAMPIMLTLLIAAFCYRHYRKLKYYNDEQKRMLENDITQLNLILKAAYYNDEQKRRFRNGLIKLIVIVNVAWGGWKIIAYCWLIDLSLVDAGKMIAQASI